MRLTLDPTRCQGYGLCHEAAPKLLDLDEWGYAALPGTEIDPADLASAREAVTRCPNAALRLEK